MRHSGRRVRPDENATCEAGILCFDQPAVEDCDHCGRWVCKDCLAQADCEPTGNCDCLDCQDLREPA